MLLLLLLLCVYVCILQDLFVCTNFIKFSTLHPPVDVGTLTSMMKYAVQRMDQSICYFVCILDVTYEESFMQWFDRSEYSVDTSILPYSYHMVATHCRKDLDDGACADISVPYLYIVSCNIE